MKIVWARLTGPADGHPSVIPLLLEGDAKESLPPVLQAQAFCDFRNDDDYFNVALELLLSLYGISSRHDAALALEEATGGRWIRSSFIRDFIRRRRTSNG